MMILPLAKVSFLMNSIMVVWVIIAVLLILIILIQKGKGGGLSAAFGGGGAGGVLGTKTGDFLTWVTIGLVMLFLFLGVVLVKFYVPETSEQLRQTSVTAPGPGTDGAGGAAPTPTPAPKPE